MSPDSATFWQAANSRCNSTDSPLINETTQSLSIRIVCDVRAFLVLLVARPAVVDILDTLLALRRLWRRRPVRYGVFSSNASHQQSSGMVGARAWRS